ncbi:thiol-disulfide isomerase-like thioredoxin [Synechococcus sp. PCC 7502]|uniref:thioredoxin domain-containing protein n=1 Tax=Synechococcus sp. PCC 7502 TaxID=1173263 RepID=UPI00029FB4AF|nr:thioredoxin domain-containing protein [Synechococcus sp. PCC 7502]AFY73228.1 thiol-disulfide isomerase-like thioredoxin [Synechococcus sp. PCC 7502]
MNSSSASSANYLRNLLVAIAAIGLTIALFFSLRVQSSEVSLKAVAQSSMPLDVALANPQPTVMEFYADWCSSCQSMAADNLSLQQQYSGKINFVMLNVDNNKWLPEIDRFQVDGIPHFVFLGADNKVLGTAIGAIPRNILTENLESMLASLPLPHIRLNSGETSPFSSPRPADTTNPRDHG